MAAERAVKLLEEYANGTVVGGTVEYNKEDMSDKVIEITYKKINDVLGTELDRRRHEGKSKRNNRKVK
jgi:phenylalanyl-tRNA synthetase beta chain